MKVLLVEDDDGIREGMSELISDHGGEVVAVPDVVAAQRALTTNRFDLVLADLRIGADSVGGKKIVGAAREVGTPVVIVSASSLEDIKRLLGDHQPDAMLTKPFQLEEVEALIARFKNAS
jgi:DNA-binding response OmpR family regulator